MVKRRYQIKPRILYYRRTGLIKILAISAILIGLACSSNDSSPNRLKPLQILAAASLTSVLPQLTQAFQEKYPEVEIEFNFAASSILAKQIEQGAKADIYFSANTQWIDYLISKNQIRPDTRIDVVSNKLVLIVPKKSKIFINDLQDLSQPFVKRIALADWTHVPAGMYAKETLEKYGIWHKIVTKCIPALDVRAALSYVERGDVECGIVYRTDTFISKKVRIAGELPAEIEPKILYSAAITKSSTHPLAKALLSFLLSNAAKDVFKQNGFVILNYE